MNKVCKTCEEEKDIEQFYVVHRHNNCRRSDCISCVSTKQKAAYIKRCEAQGKVKKDKKVIVKKNYNRQKFYDLMKTKSCMDCQESNIACLQFDHRDRANKNFNIADGVCTKAWSLVEEEIKKCDVVCANCHMKRTAKQFNWYKNLV